MLPSSNETIVHFILRMDITEGKINVEFEDLINGRTINGSFTRLADILIWSVQTFEDLYLSDTEYSFKAEVTDYTGITDFPNRKGLNIKIQHVPTNQYAFVQHLTPFQLENLPFIQGTSLNALSESLGSLLSEAFCKTQIRQIPRSETVHCVTNSWKIRSSQWFTRKKKLRTNYGKSN